MTTKQSLEHKLADLREREASLRMTFVTELMALSNAAARAAHKIETREWADGLACIGTDIDNANEAQSALEDILSEIHFAELQLEDEESEEKMTIRQTIIDSIPGMAIEYAAKSHERNYEKLHVYRDGELAWSECINQSDDIIDRAAHGFSAIPNLGITGTGSYACNCEWCNDEGYETIEDAISDAVAASDLSDIEHEMLKKLQQISLGYFTDEEEAL